jgi:hypothetical protein
MKRFFYFLLTLVISTSVFSQEASPKKHLPIIDVHVHAMKSMPQFSQELSPWFLSNMPGSDPNLPPPSFLNGDESATTLKPAKSDKEMQDELLNTMKRLNMTIVASGDAGIIRNWKAAGNTDRIIPSLAISSPTENECKSI